jgi:hypothetical protein
MTRHFIAALLILPLTLASAFAQEAPSQPSAEVSGFGTLALTRSNTDQAQFARPNQVAGVGKGVSTGVDSNLGLQVMGGVNNWLSYGTQALVRKDAEDKFRAELTLAYLKAKLSDQLSIRVGRMDLPILMLSDRLNVGYANTLLRPPVELYAQAPMTNYDGVEAAWRQSFGETTLTARLGAGRSRTRIGANEGVLHLDTTALTALNLVAERGPLTLRIGHAEGTLSLNDSAQLNGLLSALRATGAGYQLPTLGPLADALSVVKKKASFTSAGMMLNWNDIVAQGEFARRNIDSYDHDTDSWYLMGGYRIGQFLPYYSHSTTRSIGRVANTIPASCPAGYPAACTPTLQALSAGVEMLSVSMEQSTDTIGVRWDLRRSLALKVQIDRIRPKGAGLLLHATPGFTGPVVVSAVALDYVF